MMQQTDLIAELSKNADKLLNNSLERFKRVLELHDITPEALDDMVRSIRDWLNKQPHLPGDKLRDKQIVGFLLFGCFSVEKVKRNIDIYFTARNKFPDIFCDRDPLDPELAFYLKQGFTTLMPNLTPEGYRVSIMRFIPTENLKVILLFKIATMIIDYRYNNEISVGEYCIIDAENMNLKDAMQLTPTFMADIIAHATVSFGGRLIMIRIINLPAFAGGLLNLWKKFTKPKIAERVVLSTREEIQNSLPKECLPVEYGGVGGTIQEISAEWCKTLQSDAWRQFYLEHNNVFTDESKRLISYPVDEFFGVEGSFRKLELD